jgi:Cu2+-exporting ATPase
MFRDKFWLSFALTIPVIFWSTDVQHWLRYTAPSFPGSKLIPAILGTVVFIYGGLVFIRGAWGELADRKPGMMTLISLAIIVAFGTSLAATFGLFEIEVWWELASLITIMVLGHWLEMRAISQARGALNALAALLPDTAERVSGTETQTVPISELKVGDVVLVRPGTRVPADGTVVEGAADVDESMITGESLTVAKGQVARSLRERLPVAGVFEFASRQSESRPRCPASCDSSLLRKLLRLARKLSPTGPPQSFSMWQSRLGQSPWLTGGFQETKNMP